MIMQSIYIRIRVIRYKHAQKPTRIQWNVTIVGFDHCSVGMRKVSKPWTKILGWKYPIETTPFLAKRAPIWPAVSALQQATRKKQPKNGTPLVWKKVQSSVHLFRPFRRRHKSSGLVYSGCCRIPNFQTHQPEDVTFFLWH